MVEDSMSCVHQDVHHLLFVTWSVGDGHFMYSSHLAHANRSTKTTLKNTKVVPSEQVFTLYRLSITRIKLIKSQLLNHLL